MFTAQLVDGTLVVEDVVTHAKRHLRVLFFRLHIFSTRVEAICWLNCDLLL